MVNEHFGDLLMDGKGVLCHQTNYFGVMGGGIALAIKKRLLTDWQYADYQAYCNECGVSALHTVLFQPCADGRVVANMFSQKGYSADGDLTSYAAMIRCFRIVCDYAEQHRLPVSIPGYIGCGIAGGDWNRVFAIIQYVFDKSPVEANIFYRS